MKITKRDVLIFILGFITFFLIDTIFNNSTISSDMRNGFLDGLKGVAPQKIK